MSLKLFYQIVQVGSIFTLVALLLCLYRFPKRGIEIKFQAFGFLASVLAMAYIEIYRPRGLAINTPQSLQMLPATLFPLLMFNAAMKQKYRILTVTCAVVLSLFAVWNYFFGQRMHLNTHTPLVGGAFIVFQCILFFYYLMVNLSVQRLTRLPMFWCCTGYLVYYGGALFITASYQIEAFQDSLLFFWTVKNFLRIAELILIIAGLVLDVRSIRMQASLPQAQ